MATVYSSLLSLIKVITRTQNPPLHFAFLQKLQTQSLLDQVNFLLDFVEDFSHYTKRSQEIELLDSQIVAAARKAEDTIETFVVDQIKRRNSAESSSTTVDNSYAISCENLEKVVREMDLIKEEVSKIKADYIEKNQQKVKHSIQVAPGSTSTAKAKTTLPNTMVGFDEDLTKLLEKLTSNYESGRQVISVTGMGGLGKTTLATHTYNHPSVKRCFDIRAWVTISQNFSLRNTLLSLLDETESMCHNMSDEELGLKLHKFLYARKYLVVLDDIWSVTAWYEISKFLPDNENRSRIFITTRLSVSALSLESLNPYKMKFLDHDVSWNLLSSKVFDRHGEHVCPPELEEIGRVIATKCGGLPLAIVVIGGLLKVSDKSGEYWSEVAENVSSIVNRENDDQCLRILSLSYNQLPIQLKPLFIYMAIFPEDCKVNVSRLIKLWVAEGFIKPPTEPEVNRTLEDVAKEYLEDLCDRNLIMVESRSFSGNMKICKIHDLLRDVCLREARKERFICVLKKGNDITEVITSEYRLGLHPKSNYKSDSVAFPSTPLVRTIIGENAYIYSVGIFSFDLLRVLHEANLYKLDEILSLVNARYLEFELICDESFLKPAAYWPWNLESIVSFEREYSTIFLPSQIWQMEQLRHVNIRTGSYLSNPDEDTNQYCVLDNLHTLSMVLNLMLTDDILGRIPNLRKLSLFYDEVEEREEVIQSVHNLVRLQKLEKLRLVLHFSDTNYNLQNLCFPLSLIKLSLFDTRIPWENMNIVGSLPKLETLKLGEKAFCGSEWITHEGEFQCLKSLTIVNCELEIWEVEEGIHFPALEHLRLEYVKGLKDIPWGIREIPALTLLHLQGCETSLYISAKQMLLEVQEEGNDDLLIKIQTRYPDAELQALATPNFQVES